MATVSTADTSHGRQGGPGASSQVCNSQLHGRTMRPCRAATSPPYVGPAPPRVGARGRPRSSPRPGRSSTSAAWPRRQIEDIARAVGINRAIVYRHFTGKEELFALTLVGYLDELAARLADAAAASTAPRTQLAALVSAFVDYGVAHPAFVDCAHSLMRRTGTELFDEISRGRDAPARPRASRRAWRPCAPPSRPASTSGVFTVEDPVLLANTLYATGLGGLQLARVGLVIDEAAPGVPQRRPRSSPRPGRRHRVADRRAPLASWRRRLSSTVRRSTDVPGRAAGRLPRCAKRHGSTDEADRSALQDRGHALAAGGADRDQRPAGARLGEQLRGDVDDPAAGRGERVAGRERGAVDVELGPVDLAERRRRGRGAPCRTPGRPRP